MTLLSAVILLGILIFVHELGHFLVAKLMGVRVEKFSLGFGPKVLGRKYGETEYLISAFPLGGYVKMLGEDSMDEGAEPLSDEEKKRAYNHQPVIKRFPIILAGPLFNIVFAAVVFMFIFMSGVPVPYPDIGAVPEGSPAHEAGLREGDRVLRIDGTEVESFYEMMDIVSENPGKPLKLMVRRGEQVLELTVTPERKTWKDLFGEDVEGGDIGVSQLLYPDVGDVFKGSPADAAGLRKGDRILEIEGRPVSRWDEMTKIIRANPGKPLSFRIQREGEILEVSITPEKAEIEEGEIIGRIGIMVLGNTFMKKYGALDSLYQGSVKTIQISGLTVVSIIKLIQRAIPAKTIGGPIMIVQMAGQQASQGALSFFNFMAVISISLGIINLFPIPVLDGGHLVFLGIEAVRRKPLSEKSIILAQKVGLVLILMLMAFATYNDILRWLTGNWTP